MNSSSLSNSTNPCAITGQSDIYGLGIRISLYLQWYAGILAYIYSRKEAGVTITTNYLIAIAVGISCMVHYNDIYSLEVIIIAILMMVPPLALLMILGEFLLFACHKSNYLLVVKLEELKESSYPVIELIVHIGALLSTLFLLGIMVWGFFYGPSLMKDSPEGCTPMFEDDRYLEGAYATWLRVWSVALIVIAIPTMIFFMFFRAKLYYLIKKNNSEQEPSGRTEQVPSGFTALVANFVKTDDLHNPLQNGPWVKYVRPIAAVLCGAAVSTCVTTIEIVIYQNEIQSVGPVDLESAGQLIPLIIGLASFGVMIFQRYSAEMEEANKPEGSSTVPQGTGEELPK